MITTYATPLDRARALKDEFIAFADAKAYGLPSTRYVQIGEIVRDCEAVIVSVNGLVPDPLYGPIECGSPRTATFLVDIVRGCAVAYDQQQGLTIPSILEEISEIGSADGQLLDDFARESIDGWSSKAPWSVAWSLAETGILVASLQIVLGIP